jgi:hypothetical protein
MSVAASSMLKKMKMAIFASSGEKKIIDYLSVFAN